MDLKEEEYLKVLEKYPDAIPVGGNDYRLLLEINGGILLEIDFRKYPKKVKAFLINDKNNRFNLGRIVSSLREWKKITTVPVLGIIDEILLLIDNLKLNQIAIKRNFLEGLIDICIQNHPHKMTGVLGVHKGFVSEYILPSRACTYTKRDYQLIGQSCNLPFDFSYEGTFISRPSGSLLTNEKLIQVFKRRRFTMLLAHPYKHIENLKCFDTSGQILEHIIID